MGDGTVDDRRIVQLPKLGLVTESVVILSWLKGEGEEVEAGELLVEVETEKVTISVEAPFSGTIVRVLCAVGDIVRVGETIAELRVGISGVRSMEAMSGDGQVHTTRHLLSGETSGNPRASGTRTTRNEPSGVGNSSERRLATPAARRAARQLGVALPALSGSGPAGRIQLSDIEHIAAPESADGVPLSARRRAFARAMEQSARGIPQFSMACEVQVGTESEIPVSGSQSAQVAVVDYCIESVARALGDHPELNTSVAASRKGDLAIREHSDRSVGVVVRVNGGLLIPVLRDVGSRSAAEIAMRRHDLVARCASGRLALDELYGAAVTVFEGEIDGPDSFTGLVVPGTSCVLTIGRTRRVSGIDVNPTAIRRVATLSLSVDSRIADGFEAGSFLRAVVQNIERTMLPNHWRQER